MTEEEVVNVRGEEITDNGDDHRNIIKANGVAHKNGDVGGDSGALDLAADNGAASEEEHKVSGESQVTVSEVEKTRKDAVSNGSAEENTETATFDVVLRESESECVDGQNGSGSVAAVRNGVVENEIRDDDNANTVAEELVTDHDEFVVVDASDVQNGVAEEDKIGGDVNVNEVEECEISVDAEVSEDEKGVVAAVTVVDGVAAVNQTDREFEGVDVHHGVVEETVTTDENVGSDVQGRSESLSDKDVDKSGGSENVISADVSDEKGIVTNEDHDVEDGIEKNEVPVDVDGVSDTTDVKECALEDAQNSLEKEQVEPVSDVSAGVQNSLVEPEPEPSECTEENEIGVEGEPDSKLERSEEESASEQVPEGENLSALNSTVMIEDGNVVSDVAVESKGEPSVDVYEMKNNAEDSEADSSSNAVKSDGEEMKDNAVEFEAEPSKGAVQSEGEPSAVCEMKNDAVESEAEPSSSAVQSEAEPSHNIVECEAEPLNSTGQSEAESFVDVSEMKTDAVESEAEPSIDVSEMKTDAAESEAEPSSSAVQSEAEPLHNVVVCEAEPNNAGQSEAEPSVDVSEIKTDAVESEAEPSVDFSEMKTDAAESEAEPSSGAVQSEGEPLHKVGECKPEPLNNAGQSEVESSVDVSEMKTNAVESEAEPSVDLSEMKTDAAESEAEPSSSAVQSEAELLHNVVECEAEPLNNAGQSEVEPSVDVSEMKTDAVVSEAEPSSSAVQSEAEPLRNVVECEAEPLNNAGQSEVELSVDESETKTNAVEHGAEPSVDLSEMKTDAVESEAEPSVGGELSVEGEGSNHGDEDRIPATDALDEQNMSAEVVKKPFYYLIRVPRYDDDENIKEQIKNALHQVEEKTKIRDAIRAESQTKKASCKDCGQEVRAAITAERAARDLLKSKRQEMDSVQSTMNRLNNAISVGDIDGKIRNMEHMIQHETLPLNEEKQLIRQIKQLKQNREELSSNMRKQDQSQQSLDHKDSIEEHFKHLQLLKKEMEVLRNNVLKSEAATKTARKKHDDECNKLNESLARFKAADDIRQEAYAKLQALKKQLHEKSKYFWEYKNASNNGQELAAEGKKEELQCFCVDQVERIMELWNKNDEFRKDYVRCNTRSTLRRLQTLDGRSLGPDEEPPVVPNAITERASKNNSILSQSTLEQEKKSISTESLNIKDEPVSKVVVQRTERSQTTKAKPPTKPAPLEKSVARWGDESDEDTKEEEPVKTKEEEELILKAEKARKEEEAAKLKEKRRLEEIEKAKEALQRKKRNAEKAQQRAALKAQKEAEQKEKEREKKARKKERRKAASADTAENTEQESAPSSETLISTEECDQSEKPAEVTKKPQKPSHFTRQTKAKSLPLALRNRGKRRIQPWMWVLIAVLVVVALFYVGNSSSLRSSLERFGF